MTDEKAVQPIEKAGRSIATVSGMMGRINNWAGHEGNMVGYLRTKNITPPLTARTQRSRKS